jgi:hypothetical protein
MQVFHFLFSVYFLFAVIQFSNQKIPELKKYLGGDIPPLAPLCYQQLLDHEAEFYQN